MNIIITGASRGIGYELSLKLAENPDNKIIALARSEEKLKKLKNAARNNNIVYIVSDINEYIKSPEKALKSISGHLDKADILINNAGFLINKSFEDLSYEEISNVLNTNFISPVLLIKTVLPLMNKGSHVVNIGSMGGFQGSSKYNGLSVYSASKAALASITECLASEFSDRGISFNCLAPGAADTEMLNEAFPGYKAPVSASGIADFIAWFAVNGNKYFNGKILPVSVSNP